MITLPIRASEMKEVPIFVAIFYVDCRVIRKGDVLVKWGPMDQHLNREAIFEADQASYTRAQSVLHEQKKREERDAFAQARQAASAAARIPV